jgi:hypothetical protein
MPIDIKPALVATARLAGSGFFNIAFKALAKGRAAAMLKRGVRESLVQSGFGPVLPPIKIRFVSASKDPVAAGDRVSRYSCEDGQGGKEDTVLAAELSGGNTVEVDRIPRRSLGALPALLPGLVPEARQTSLTYDADMDSGGRASGVRFFTPGVRERRLSSVQACRVASSGLQIGIPSDRLLSCAHTIKDILLFSDLDKRLRDDICECFCENAKKYLKADEESNGAALATWKDEVQVLLTRVLAMMRSNLIVDPPSLKALEAEFETISGKRETLESVHLPKFIVEMFSSLVKKNPDTSVRATVSEVAGFSDIRRLVSKRVLRAAMENMLSNAFKYTPPGGEIALYIDEVSQVRFAFRVANTGGDRAREEYKGVSSGIGLRGVVSELSKHGGCLSRLSDLPLGSGACFGVVLNFATTSLPPIDMGPPAAAAAHAGRCIDVAAVSDRAAISERPPFLLFVDDVVTSCKTNQHALNTVLSNRGVDGRADTATSPVLARERFYGHNYKIVVLDFDLKSDATGFDLFLEFVQARPEVHYFMQTDLVFMQKAVKKYFETGGNPGHPFLDQRVRALLATGVIHKQRVGVGVRDFLHTL